MSIPSPEEHHTTMTNDQILRAAALIERIRAAESEINHITMRRTFLRQEVEVDRAELAALRASITDPGAWLRGDASSEDAP